MPLGIKKDTLSFQVLPVNDPRIMVFLDTSEYKEQPERPLLEVTLPGHARYTLVNIIAGKVNTLNSNLIGYSKLLSTTNSVELPDGVYTLKYKICPYEFVFTQQYHLRTVQLRCKLRQIQQHLKFSDCRINDQDSFKKEIIDLMLLIDTGEAEAVLDNPSKASELYQKAVKKASYLLEKLNKSC